MLPLPLVAMGMNCVPALERCVGGLVVDRGWEHRVRPEPLEKMSRDPNEGLARLMTAARAIELGRKLCDDPRTLLLLNGDSPITAFAAELGLTLNEARMCIRLFIKDEKGAITKGASIKTAEVEAGIRDHHGNIVKDFR